MASTPETRLMRLTQHARHGWQAMRENPALRQEARDWLLAHPSPRSDVDRLWLASLEGSGPLAEWLDRQAPPQAWEGPLPLHTVLASHPFPSLRTWLIRTTSRAS